MVKQEFEKLVSEFKDKFGYELITNDPKFPDFCDYWRFQRTVDGNNTHELILEDHRWERGMKNFDPERDVGDWLIFSFLTDDERDWFGHYVNTQYPLTLSEYKLIEKIIHVLEENNEQEDGRGGEKDSATEASGGEQPEEPGYFGDYHYSKEPE